MSTDINNRTKTQHDVYFARIANETEIWNSLKRKFRYQCCVQSSNHPKESLILTLPALAMYCTYRRNIATRLGVTQKREPYRAVMWKRDGNDDLEDLDSSGGIILKWVVIGREGLEWIHTDHDTNQFWAVVKTVMNVWRNKFKRKEFFSLWPTVWFYCGVEKIRYLAEEEGVSVQNGHLQGQG